MASMQFMEHFSMDGKVHLVLWKLILGTFMARALRFNNVTNTLQYIF